MAQTTQPPDNVRQPVLTAAQASWPWYRWWLEMWNALGFSITMPLSAGKGAYILTAGSGVTITPSPGGATVMIGATVGSTLYMPVVVGGLVSEVGNQMVVVRWKPPVS